MTKLLFLLGCLVCITSGQINIAPKLTVELSINNTQVPAEKVWGLFECVEPACKYIRILAYVVVSSAGVFLILIIIIVYLACTRYAVDDTTNSENGNEIDFTNGYDEPQYSQKKKNKNSKNPNVIEMSEIDIDESDNQSNKNTKQKRERREEMFKRMESNYDSSDDFRKGPKKSNEKTRKPKEQNHKKEQDHIRSNVSKEPRKEQKKTGKKNERADSSSDEDVIGAYDDRKASKTRKNYVHTDDENEDSFKNPKRPEGLPKNSVPVLPFVPKNVIQKVKKPNDSNLNNVDYYRNPDQRMSRTKDEVKQNIKPQRKPRKAYNSSQEEEVHVV